MYQFEKMPFIRLLLNVMKQNFPTVMIGFVLIGHICSLQTHKAQEAIK